MAIYGTAAALPTTDLPQTAAEGRERESAIRQPLVMAETALAEIRSRLAAELAQARLDADARIEAVRAQFQGEQQQARAAIDQARVQVEAERVELDRRRSAVLTALDQYETQALGGISTYGRQVRAAYEQAQNPYAPGVRQLTGFAAGGVQRLPRYVIGGETDVGGGESSTALGQDVSRNFGPGGQPIPTRNAGAGVMTWQDFDPKAVAQHNPMQADQGGREVAKREMDRAYQQALAQLRQAEALALRRVAAEERDALARVQLDRERTRDGVARQMAELTAAATTLRTQAERLSARYPQVRAVLALIPAAPSGPSMAPAAPQLPAPTPTPWGT